jgi:ABC-type multidrug transport system fused ATPase/permease subunit
VNRSLALPFRLLRSDPGLIARFAAASLGRPALTAASILLIREFLGGVLGQREGLAGWAARTYGSGTALWAVVALLMLAHLGATALTYSSQVSQQKMVKVIELGTMERLIRRLLGLSIGFFDRRTHGDLIQAVRQDVSHLRSAAEIHDDIMAMREGYETLVGLGDRQLSRGEAQRINIARAILKSAPILLLDEATSSLDSSAEAKVQQALDRRVPGQLAVWVTHRLSTLRSASRILVLEAGRVVGLGTHAHLLDRCPTYRRLWEAQAGPAPDAPFSPDASAEVSR